MGAENDRGNDSDVVSCPVSDQKPPADQAHEVPRLVVVNESVLGYVFPQTPSTMGVLARSDISGGYGPYNAPISVAPGRDQLRAATKEDFAAFRICSKGYFK